MGGGSFYRKAASAICTPSLPPSLLRGESSRKYDNFSLIANLVWWFGFGGLHVEVMLLTAGNGWEFFFESVIKSWLCGVC